MTISDPLPEIVAKAFTRDDALADLRKLRTTGSQRFLSARWGERGRRIVVAGEVGGKR